MKAVRVQRAVQEASRRRSSPEGRSLQVTRAGHLPGLWEPTLLTSEEKGGDFKQQEGHDQTILSVTCRANPRSRKERWWQGETLSARHRALPGTRVFGRTAQGGQAGLFCEQGQAAEKGECSSYLGLEGRSAETTGYGSGGERRENRMEIQKTDRGPEKGSFWEGSVASASPGQS